MENLGVRGATMQSWQRDLSIRVHIKELQDQYPNANEARLIRLLADRMRDDDEILIAAAEYAVHNAISVQRSYQRLTPEQKAEREALIAAAAKKTADQIILLNQEAPNGKRWRRVTREELG